MRHIKAFSILVLFTSIFLMAAMCEDECDKCQSSIDHMYDKIEGQGCNPNTMQKAWDRIREDCDHFDSAVGLMAETCSAKKLAKPSCNTPGIDLSEHNINIVLRIRPPQDADHNIIINVHDQSYIYEIEMDPTVPDFGFPEKIEFSPENIVIHEGDVFEFIIEVIDENGVAQEVEKKTQTFTFVRTNIWDFPREVLVNLRSDNPHFIFDAW